MDAPAETEPRHPRPTDDPSDDGVTPAVTRSVELDAPPHEVWHAVADDDERAAWWGGDTHIPLVPGGQGHATDPDGTRRRIEVDHVEPGHRLVYHWWVDDGEPDGPASQVELVVLPRPGGSRLTVTETRASASAAAGRRPPVRARFVDLELLLLGRRTSVLV